MTNPKITLSVEQNILDAITNLAMALNRCAEVLPAVVTALNDVQAEQIPAGATVPLVAAPTMMAAENTGVGVALPPVNAAESNAAIQMPTNTAPVPTPTPVPAPVPPLTMPTANSAPVIQQPSVMPTASGVEITEEMLMRAGVELTNRGVNAMAVLMEFGVQGVNQLPKEQYPAFAARLRSLGANI